MYSKILKTSEASIKAWATRTKNKPATHQAGAKPTEELFSDKQIVSLTNAFSSVSKVNPSSPAYRKVVAHLDAMGPGKLKQIAHARIPFMSSLARNRLVRKK